METNFDTSFYDSIASSMTSDYWEGEAYQSSQNFMETPIEYTLTFWEDNSQINLFPTTPESLSSCESNRSLLSSDSGNHSIETTSDNLIDIPGIDNITFEQLEGLIFKGPVILPTIDENELQDMLEFIERDLKQPVKLDLDKNIEKQFKCVACQKTFTSRPGIRKHFHTKRHKEIVAKTGEPDPATMTETWTKETYDCFVCGKSFAKYANMIDHVVNH